MNHADSSITSADEIGKSIITGLMVLYTVMVPILIIPTGWDPFRFPKVLLTRAVAILLVAFLGYRWGRRPVLPRLRAMEWSVVAVLGWTTFATLMSEIVWVSAWALADTVAVFVIFFAARWISERSGSLWLPRLIFIPACINAVVLIGQVLDLWHPLVSAGEFESLPEGDRLVLSRAALMGNRNELGLFFALAFAVALAVAAHHGGRTRKISILTAVLCFTSVLLTGTLTAIIAASAVLLAVSIVESARRSSATRKRILVGLLLLLVALPLVFYPFYSARLGNLMSQLKQGSLTGAMGERNIAFLTAGAMIAAHPLVGEGPGTFGSRFLFQKAALTDSIPDARAVKSSRTFFDMAHNDYLEIASETGLIGLALSLTLLIIYLGSYHHLRFRESRVMKLAIGLTLIISALYLFPLQVAGVYGPLAVVGGAADARRVKS